VQRWREMVSIQLDGDGMSVKSTHSGDNTYYIAAVDATGAIHPITTRAFDVPDLEKNLAGTARKSTTHVRIPDHNRRRSIDFCNVIPCDEWRHDQTLTRQRGSSSQIQMGCSTLKCQDTGCNTKDWATALISQSEAPFLMSKVFKSWRTREIGA
jgi:hypothetical protein